MLNSLGYTLSIKFGMHVLILGNIYNTHKIYRKSVQQTSSRYVQKDGMRGKYVSLIVNRPNYPSIKKFVILRSSLLNSKAPNNLTIDTVLS